MEVNNTTGDVSMNITSMKSVIRHFGSAALATATAAVTLAALTPAYASSGTSSLPCSSDTSEPAGTITWSPTILWPPNHKLVPITISLVHPFDNETGHTITVKVTGINASQGSPYTGVGNSGTAPENATAVTSVSLTSERAGNIPGGQVYTITVTCDENEDNNPTPVKLNVLVPHDQGN